MLARHYFTADVIVHRMLLLLFRCDEASDCDRVMCGDESAPDDDDDDPDTNGDIAGDEFKSATTNSDAEDHRVNCPPLLIPMTSSTVTADSSPRPPSSGSSPLMYIGANRSPVRPTPSSASLPTTRSGLNANEIQI